MKLIKSLALLTLPVWGLIVLIALASLSPNGGDASGEGLLFIAVLLLFAGATPIFSLENQGTLSKAFLFVLYACTSAVAMFVAGWGALGMFGVAR